MTLSIDLPDEALARLHAEASRRGVGIETVIAKLAEQLPANWPEHSGRSLAFVGAGASKNGTTPRIEELLTDGFGRD